MKYHPNHSDVWAEIIIVGHLIDIITNVKRSVQYVFANVGDGVTRGKFRVRLRVNVPEIVNKRTVNIIP